MSTPDDRLQHALASLPRPRRRGAFLLGLFVCMAIALVCLVVGIKGGKPPGPNAALIVGTVVGFLGAAAFGIALGVHLQRIRTESLSIIAAALGLEIVTKPARESRASLFAPFSSLSMLRTGEKGIRLHMGGGHAGRRVDLIEHSYVVSTGKSAQTVVHTAAATPCPVEWPRLSLTPRHALAKLWEAVAGQDLQLESSAFNDRWTIKTDNPDFAILFLSPEVQEFLADAPSHETWHIAGGSLCWVSRGQLRPAEIPRPVERLVRLRDLLPAELDYWGR